LSRAEISQNLYITCPCYIDIDIESTNPAAVHVSSFGAVY